VFVTIRRNTLLRIIPLAILAGILLSFTQKPADLRKLRMHFVSKSQRKGLTSTLTGDIFYQAGKGSVAHYVLPSEFMIVTDTGGSSLMYQPGINTVSRIDKPLLGSVTYFTHIFLKKRGANLGLPGLGFAANGNRNPSPYKVSVWKAPEEAKAYLSKAEITLLNGVPVTVRYFGPAGKLAKKVSFSNGKWLQGTWFPQNITTTSWFTTRDSSVEKTTFSAFLTNEQATESEYFRFEIPENAKQMN
jgi:outer membrane lipoprotein-sorting protein